MTQTARIRLDAALAAVCPIHGTSGDPPVIQFKAEATAPQQSAATAALASFDFSQAADDLWTAQQSNAVVGRIAPVRLTANRVNSTNVLADVTDLAFQLLPNRHYVFNFAGAYTAAAGTTGLSLAINGPASPTLFRLLGRIAEGATAIRQGAASAYNTAITGANSGGATAMPFWIEGNISTGAAGGLLQLRFASEVNASAVTVLAGSWGELKAVA